MTISTQSLAVRACEERIAVYAIVSAECGVVWLDLGDNPEKTAELAMELEFLDSRGFLEWHPTRPWVRVVYQEA